MFSTRFAVSLVGSHSSPVFGRYLRLRSVVVRKNSSLGENLVLAALFREDPSLVGCCSRSILGRFGRSFVGKNPVWDKNPFLAAFLQENPILWEKPFLLVVIEVGRYFSLFSLYRSSGDFFVGKTRSGKNLRFAGRSRLLWRVLALLAICSLPVFGRLPLFAVGRCCEKLVLREKPLSCEENPGCFREKPLYGGLWSGWPCLCLAVLGIFLFSWPIR